jgi:hypothetical protein
MRQSVPAEPVTGRDARSVATPAGDASSNPAGVREPTRLATLAPAVARCSSSLDAFLYAASPRALRNSALASLLTTCAVLGVQLWTGPNAAHATAHDLLIPLDAAWRVCSGQIPHNDFYSPLGPVFVYWAALWMKLLGPVPSIVHYSIVAQGVVVAVCAGYIGRARLTALSSWLFCSVVLLLAVAPFPVGWPPEVLDSAMSYNRLGFAILAILIVEAALPIRQTRGSPAVAAAIAGASFGVLVLLKLNFAAIGAGTQLLVLLHRERAAAIRKRARYLALGAGSVAFIFFVLLGVHPASFLSDMLMLRSVFAESHPHLAAELIALLKELLPRVLGFGVLLALSARWQRQTPDEAARPTRRLWLAFSFLLAADLALGISNTQPPALTLTPFIALLAFETFGPERPRLTASATSHPGSTTRAALIHIARVVPALAWLGVLLLSSATEPLLGLRASLDEKWSPRRWSYGLVGQGPGSVSVLAPTDPYPLLERDGSALLRRNLRPGDEVVTLDFTNPFNFGLRLPPPGGDALWWHLGKTFTQRTFPAPARVFASATLILIARRWAHDVSPIYETFIAAHYERVDVSPHWQLFRRRAR